MKRVNIVIIIDSNSRRLELCILENMNLDPRSHFKFRDGAWIGVFDDFPIAADNDVDILIVAVGNPFSNSTMKVSVDGVDKGTFNLYKPFNRNGYGQFNEEVV